MYRAPNISIAAITVLFFLQNWGSSHLGGGDTGPEAPLWSEAEIMRRRFLGSVSRQKVWSQCPRLRYERTRQGGQQIGHESERVSSQREGELTSGVKSFAWTC